MNKLSGKCIDYPYNDNRYYEEYTYVNHKRDGEYKIINKDFSVFGTYENGIITNRVKLDKNNNIEVYLLFLSLEQF